ncbi:MAG: hypothetical protein K2L88_00815, partial [Clostridiales bacterium]|nr:hypothetical protein [Clostridiales bacterium]
DGLKSAATAYNRLRSSISACAALPKADADTAKKVQAQKLAIVDAVYDDLNYPLALGELWTMAKYACREVYDAAVELDSLFGLDLHLPIEQAENSDVPVEVKELAEKRFAARKAKDWATSDALRAELDALGYTVLDGKDGYEIKKK